MKKKIKTLLELSKTRISILNNSNTISGGEDGTVIGNTVKDKSKNIFCLTKIELACVKSEEQTCEC